VEAALCSKGNWKVDERGAVRGASSRKRDCCCHVAPARFVGTLSLSLIGVVGGVTSSESSQMGNSEDESDGPVLIRRAPGRRGVEAANTEGTGTTCGNDAVGVAWMLSRRRASFPEGREDNCGGARKAMALALVLPGAGASAESLSEVWTTKGSKRLESLSRCLKD